MIRGPGNKWKDTVRCPHCGFENHPQPPLRSGEHLIALGCVQCGEWVIRNSKAWVELGWDKKEAQ